MSTWLSSQKLTTKLDYKFIHETFSMLVHGVSRRSICKCVISTKEDVRRMHAVRSRVRSAIVSNQRQYTTHIATQQYAACLQNIVCRHC